jgi:hypothetical protein
MPECVVHVLAGLVGPKSGGELIARDAVAVEREVDEQAELEPTQLQRSQFDP